MTLLSPKKALLILLIPLAASLNACAVYPAAGYPAYVAPRPVAVVRPYYAPPAVVVRPGYVRPWGGYGYRRWGGWHGHWR
ncbi:hypothetical protein KFZ76_20355 [Methylovulum psychrotolerans]|jgi:hypothetical protein|uniref:hypothetical protein n=1 Tax=Methylovulum psychrotolerans TaxID=1704499 RepID=UPI001BFF3D3C|nr:hypothetical protein [Methylovulum psychrotolerans]MBT9100058.1 hypothetical protein [Methylovulum psychrotolerans]